MLAHSAIDGMPVTDEAMLEAHRADRGTGDPYVLARLSPCNRPLDCFDEDFDWEEAAERQRTLFEQDVRPLLREHPSWPLVYFGMVPIPLAVHLGFLVGQMVRIESRLFHHVNRNWAWPKARGRRLVAGKRSPIAQDPAFRGSVVTRVATSYGIEPGQTDAVVPNARCFDVRAEVIDPDSIRSSSDLEAIVRAYKGTIDDIANTLPNADMRHLFAAVPVGLAFRLGSEINPNIHVPLQTWQHMSRRRPEYRRAILLSPRVRRPRVLIIGASPPDTPPTTAAEEIEEISDLLQECGEGVEVTSRPALTLEELPELLRRVDPMFVHFAGHGRTAMTDDGGASNRDLRPATSALVVHHSGHDPHARPAELGDLTRWLAGRQRRVVVLTACNSEALAQAAATTNSVCIGFRRDLPDEQARVFAREFWKSMRIPGHSVDRAFLDGRAQLDPTVKEQACLFPPGAGSDVYLIPRGGNHG